MSDDATPPAGPVRRFVRRWTRRLAALVALLLVAAYFSPRLIGNTGLRNAVAAKAAGKLKGTVTVGGASLGWFWPVELRDVEVRDADGRTILAAPKVTSSKSLLSLARSQSDLGTFTIEQPRVEIVSENRTTNLEQAVADFLTGESSGGPSPAVAVRVVGGTVSIVDADRKQTHTFTDVDAAAAVPASGDIEVVVKAAAGGGRLDADVTLGATTAVKLKADAFPLEVAGVAARRFDPGAAVGGKLTADFAAVIAPGSVRAAGAVSAVDLELASAHLGGESLKLAKLDLPCAVETANGLVTVERADLTCDLGTASFAGTFDPAAPPEKLLDRPGLRANADVDIAKLAAMFPKLLRLREGTALQQGRVAARLASTAGPAGTTWDGGVTASALRGTRDGKPLAWDQPFEASFAGRLGADRRPVFDRLDCKAEFVTATAAGGLDNFRATADISLDRLAARLGEFVDLQGVTLAGTARVQVANRPDGAGGSTVGGSVALANFALADGTRNLREPSLTVEFEATGAFAADAPVRVAAGKIKAIAGPDVLDVALLDPIADARSLATGKAAAKLTGDLARWRSRASGFVAIPAKLVIGGEGTITGTVRFDADRISIDGVTGDLAKVKFEGYGVRADEPQLKLLPTDVAIDRKTGVVDVPRLQAATQTVGVGAEKVRLTPLPDGSYNVSMSGVMNANLLRVQRTLKLQSDPALGDAINGMVKAGTFTVDAVGTTYKFKANLPVEAFALGSPQKPAWAEPQLSIAVEGEYDIAADNLKLTSAKVERPSGLAVQMAGAVNQASTVTDLDVAGKVSYDLAQLEPQLRNYLGAGVKAVGKDTRDFKLTGKLADGTAVVAVAGTPAPAAGGLANLTGNAGFGWQSLRAYGFDVGQAELKANLDHGVLKVDPLEAAFGQTGKVRLEPTVFLNTPGTDMTLAKGKLIDHAKLTPAACADALGYALPAIARSSETEGTISFDLDDNRVPLANPDAATVKGRLTLHSVQVGPGPLLTEIATLLGAQKTKVQLANEQVVPIRVENGRVAHENLRLTFNGYAISTTGSVGMDGSMNIVVDMPVPDAAIGAALKNNPRIREAIAAKRISVPVGGTVSAPRVDRQAFQVAVRQFAEQVGKDALKDVGGDLKDKGKDLLKKELGKGLEKFLPPQPPQPKKP